MRVLISGGSASGKSEFAENLAYEIAKDKLFYIATMKHFGEEAIKRIERHKLLRENKGFETLEVYSDLKDLYIPENSTVLLECMSNLLANEMFDNGHMDDAVDEIMKGIKNILNSAANLIVVSNDVFCDGVEYTAEIAKYIENLGHLNRLLVSGADEAYEVIYTIPVKIK